METDAQPRPAPPLVVYVDGDDTLVRSVGTKRIPVPGVVRHARDLYEAGAELYCWSSGGADYARESAQELSIADCFHAFLPKPHVLPGDQEPHEWRGLLTVHPATINSLTVAEYKWHLAQKTT